MIKAISREVLFWLLRIDLFLIVGVLVFFYIIDVISEPALKYGYSGNILVILIVGFFAIGVGIATSVYSTKYIKDYLSKMSFIFTIVALPLLMVPILYFVWGLIRPCGEICY